MCCPMNRVIAIVSFKNNLLGAHSVIFWQLHVSVLLVVVVVVVVMVLDICMLHIVHVCV